ncbi:hypothetical protein V6Z11_D06G069900 [Gossypium hirsutum]
MSTMRSQKGHHQFHLFTPLAFQEIAVPPTINTIKFLKISPTRPQNSPLVFVSFNLKTKKKNFILKMGSMKFHVVPAAIGFLLFALVQLSYGQTMGSSPAPAPAPTPSSDGPFTGDGPKSWISQGPPVANIDNSKAS